MAGASLNITIDVKCDDSSHRASEDASKRSLLRAGSLRHGLVDAFLELEKLDLNLFRAHHLISGTASGTNVYGGQVIGQALVAASNTVDEVFSPHSLHCYFIKYGDTTMPILYQVDRVRDSRSFCTRFVKAIQNGEALFTSEMSFHKLEPDSIAHQACIPDVPPPEECADIGVFWEQYLHDPSALSAEGRLAIDAVRKVLDVPKTFELKFVNPRQNVQAPIDGTLKFQVWVKAKEAIPDDEDHRLHQCIAAFISDITPIGTPIGPHAGRGFKLGMAASLDHSIWIHRPDFRIDDWCFYQTESTVAAGSRALVFGKLWTRDGQLVMSTAQEILVRAERE